MASAIMKGKNLCWVLWLKQMSMYYWPVFFLIDISVPCFISIRANPYRNHSHIPYGKPVREIRINLIEIEE